MRISACNQITGRICHINRGLVTALVQINVAPGLIISATVSNEMIDELDLETGQNAVAIIKASNVLVGISEWEKNNKPVQGEPLL